MPHIFCRICLEHLTHSRCHSDFAAPPGRCSASFLRKVPSVRVHVGPRTGSPHDSGGTADMIRVGVSKNQVPEANDLNEDESANFCSRLTDARGGFVFEYINHERGVKYNRGVVYHFSLSL